MVFGKDDDDDDDDDGKLENYLAIPLRQVCAPWIQSVSSVSKPSVPKQNTFVALSGKV